MERARTGPILFVAGFLLFIVSLVILLQIPSLYLLSLFSMFMAVVLIAIGAAFTKGIDKSLTQTKDDCYYCNGSGKVNGETCPRCGGTGLAPDDQ
ncbi:MAG: hypothetical protein JW779_02735 [Candidatus Thorarchaeota archaeon]|nr:hypothetical protein [Candidatus Thorarchaeota archaeon]